MPTHLIPLRPYLIDEEERHIIPVEVCTSPSFGISTPRENQDNLLSSVISENDDTNDPNEGLGTVQTLFVLACVRKLLQEESCRQSSTFSSPRRCFSVSINSFTSGVRNQATDVTRSTASSRAKMVSPRV